jgi:hypothetical protein
MNGPPDSGQERPPVSGPPTSLHSSLAGDALAAQGRDTTGWKGFGVRQGASDASTGVPVVGSGDTAEFNVIGAGIYRFGVDNGGALSRENTFLCRFAGPLIFSSCGLEFLPTPAVR